MEAVSTQMRNPRNAACALLERVVLDSVGTRRHHLFIDLFVLVFVFHHIGVSHPEDVRTAQG
jgi:hypothetical protein